MTRAVQGIHHITALAGDPQANLDFYAGVLGLRLVKRTVNFDDPTTYHLYFGNERGDPGTIITFFPWPGAPRGRTGTGQVTVAAFAITESAIDYWMDRLSRQGVALAGPETRFDETVLSFRDPDGLALELVAHADAERQEPRAGGLVPTEYGIRGLHNATLAQEGYEGTDRVLTEVLGFNRIGQAGNRYRYEVGEGGPGALVDVVCTPDARPGRVAVGTVHHIAWRARDESEQLEWRRDLAAAGLNVTPVLDRQYFRSVYFREPGGVLFEIATDPPGFAIDEPQERLGEALRLPHWLEPRRERIEAALPPLRTLGID